MDDAAEARLAQEIDSVIAWVDTPFSTYTICLINLPTGYHITSPTGALDSEEAFEVISLVMGDNSGWAGIEREMIRRGLIDRDDCRWPRDRVREAVRKLLFFEEMYVVEGMDYWWEPIPGYFGIIEPKEKDAHDAAALVAPKLFSPRWGHVDVGRREATSESAYASHGDGLRLSVSVRGVDDGERVRFCLSDRLCDDASGQLLDRVEGSAEGGVATAQWRLRDRRPDNDLSPLRLEFWAEMRDLTTERVAIEVGYPVFRFLVRRALDLSSTTVAIEKSEGEESGPGETVFEGTANSQGELIAPGRLVARGARYRVRVGGVKARM